MNLHDLPAIAAEVKELLDEFDGTKATEETKRKMIQKIVDHFTLVPHVGVKTGAGKNIIEAVISVSIKKREGVNDVDYLEKFRL